MADSKTTALVEDGRAFIEVHDPADVPEVAAKLLAAADDPNEVDTATHAGGVGFRVSEKLAKKAKLVQTASRAKASDKKPDDKSANEESKPDDKSTTEESKPDGKASDTAGDPPES
ncbi:hypothetical protein PQD13_gp46 [Gordonia phage Clawz]|uniref:Uncharacterized protein n=1 Tax=Gordonia phage Clawz TaxID=2743910 RepID=A0AAE7K674_9CAUD|nr:hypothetical protein PQD13_gp46 [Gordonia phage Clawz]QKY79958.1 hypothetical protein SEA_CLAWZ_46 [Gordonia phage Clawz]